MARVFFWSAKDGETPVFVDEDTVGTVAECEICGCGIKIGDECYKIQDSYYCTDCVSVGEMAIDDENEGIPEPWT